MYNRLCSGHFDRIQCLRWTHRQLDCVPIKGFFSPKGHDESIASHRGSWIPAYGRLPIRTVGRWSGPLIPARAPSLLLPALSLRGKAWHGRGLHRACITLASNDADPICAEYLLRTSVRNTNRVASDCPLTQVLLPTLK